MHPSSQCSLPGNPSLLFFKLRSSMKFLKYNHRQHFSINKTQSTSRYNGSQGCTFHVKIERKTAAAVSFVLLSEQPGGGGEIGHNTHKPKNLLCYSQQVSGKPLKVTITSEKLQTTTIWNGIVSSRVSGGKMGEYCSLWQCAM